MPDKKTGNELRMKRLELVLPLCLAAAVLLDLAVPAAFAHGSSTNSSSGALALLIFPAAAILFALFLVFIHRKKGWTVLVTGGAGYVGSALVPKLLQRRHNVVVLDLKSDGDEIFKHYREHINLRLITGDFRDQTVLAAALRGCDAVIHLACMTPPSSPDPDLVKSINAEAFKPLLGAAKKAGVKRFVFASSWLVYGVCGEAPVTEDRALAPVTEFAKDKALCEAVLAAERAPGFVTCTLRPAAVCGDAPRRRPDLVVNRLVEDAFHNGCMRISDSAAKIPNIHIADLADLYTRLLNQPDARIDGKVYNAVTENLTFAELAGIVKRVVGDELSIRVEGANQTGSCQLSSDKMKLELGFEPRYSVEDAIHDLASGFRRGKNTRRTAAQGRLNKEMIGQASSE